MRDVRSTSTWESGETRWGRETPLGSYAGMRLEEWELG